MAHISPVTVASEAARDAVLDWEEGDIVYCLAEHTLSFFDGTDWQTIANLGDLA